MAVRRSKAMAAATEAKVADTAAEVSATEAKTVKTLAEAAESLPEAPQPAVGTVSAVAAPAEPAAPTVLPTVPLAAPPADTPLPAGTAQSRVMMEKTMEQVTKTTEGLFKAAEEAAEFSRGNVEAVTKAAQIYVAGVQDLGKQTLAMVQGLADHTVAGAKALGTVKSLKEAAEIQATFARGALEKSMSETAKLQEAALKLAEASFAPISARLTLAVEKFGKPLAV